MTAQLTMWYIKLSRPLDQLDYLLNREDLGCAVAGSGGKVLLKMTGDN